MVDGPFACRLSLAPAGNFLVKNPPLLRRLFRVKSPESTMGDAANGGLTRSMGLFALLMFSVGSIIGTGIFVILGEAIPKAGPSVLLSFVLAATVCGFSALSYAELAGSIPVSGSSYSYAYATLGELVAWVCGWCLMLEYGVSVAAIAVGWGQYLNEFLVNFGWHIPARFANPPGENGGMLNLPAAAVVLACMVFLLRGASESSRLNNVMVLLKIAILVFFAVVAVSVFDGDKFSPFMPLGVAGIGAAAGQVFFSYIGFDAASTAGEEAKNPRRDLPIAIIGSLIIVTALYLLVAAVTIGAHGGQPADYQGQAGEAILARIAGRVTGGPWAGALIALGAVISIFSVVLCTLYGQTRVLYAMSRDGLLPAVFRQLDPRTGTPVRNTVIVSLLIAVLASLVPLGQLAEATSIGTLLVFGIVNLGVISLRRSRPELPRTFRTPLYPFTPLFGLVGCLYLITSLDRITWLVFAAWMVLGLAIYFSFGFRRSHLAAVPAAGVS